MALVTCKDCNKDFSTDAKRCPHCGAKPPVTNTSGCLWVFLLLVAGVVSIGMIGAMAGPGSDKTKDPRDHVLGACREFIKDHLHDNTDVEFDRVYPMPIYEAKETYMITLPLRARNGFGALRHFSVECTIRIDMENKKYQLVRLREIR